VLLISSKDPRELATLSNTFAEDGIRVVTMSSVKPALRALLKSTGFGACILDVVDLDALRMHNLEEDLQSFVGRGGILLGFGKKFVTLCQALFYTNWEADEEPVPIATHAALHLLPHHPYAHVLQESSLLPHIFASGAVALNHVADDECIYRITGQPLETSDSLQIMVNHLLMNHLQVKSFAALSCYGAGSYAYCGTGSLTQSADIIEFLRHLLRTSYQVNSHEGLKIVPSVKSRKRRTALWRSQKRGDDEDFDDDDTEDEESMSLIEALTTYFEMRYTLGGKTVTIEGDAEEATIPTSLLFKWMCG
jgi:hypothetical protein